MFSKAFELTGLAAIAVAIAFWATWEAGLLFGGLSLIFVGSTIDDTAVGAYFHGSFGRIRYSWSRQLARENGASIDNWMLTEWLRAKKTTQLIPCVCGGKDENCPLCDGDGLVPNPEYREQTDSPHPTIKVDLVAQQDAFRAALAKTERAKLHNRTPARPPVNDLERLA